MKVILLQDVPALGRAGTLVEVKEGYARNYLLPRGLAREATAGAIRAREVLRQAEEQRRARMQRETEQLAQALSALTLEIPARAGAEGRLFGAVTAQQVADALRQRGFPVDKKQVELEHPIRVEGFHRVAVRLPTGRLVRVAVNVVGRR
ncbi:MAG: 50S ribosomal protein L9 [Armatimonadota bacterium]|nr:50S ribosomal protein L9 [Armatimonadota bacterium]MDR7463790.1 50S ribosomal protein L9 [Armatimonadota bacterium]MDR7469464.1 50S ribosomal protein L9 [Armatimonadota bacterium]MDR7473830.1 50S ribosomal protein L9 [Armatimonadota bacterium]MDR7539111.1 50S ribosomal protein L9 [Armatimonadota bacterium]